jgi:hypothetical protein
MCKVCRTFHLSSYVNYDFLCAEVYETPNNLINSGMSPIPKYVKVGLSVEIRDKISFILEV